MKFLAWLLAGWIFATAPVLAEDLLVDQYNQRVSASRLSGHWLLVYFGYTRCHDICPAALTRMKSVLTRLESSRTTLIPVFISLDPANDTPAQLREFSARFPRLLAMTGSATAIADAASRFGVVWRPAENGSGIDHGSLWYLVSPDSHVVKMIPPTQSLEETWKTIRSALADHH